jgi:signal recognition particle GTPase
MRRADSYTKRSKSIGVKKIFANAKTRIAETAGCTVRDVEHMIKQYAKMKQQMAMSQRMGGMEAVMQKMQQGGFPGAK